MIDTNDILATHEKGKDARRSAEEMDVQRRKTLAYEYLCHLEEAKTWMETCLREILPVTTELEENLRNGVYLAKLGHFMTPDTLSLNKIYDIEQRRYRAIGLQFRHTDNINHFLRCLKCMELPLTFQPETTDIYDKKNMPRLIYCIHALSSHLFKLGKAPQMQDLYGKVDFTDEEIEAVNEELQKNGIQMPSFQKIGGLLTNSLTRNTAALHTAVMAVNQALMENDKAKVLSTLQSKAAELSNVMPTYIAQYTEMLSEAKTVKAKAALNKSCNESYESDTYDDLLTQPEIQGHINCVNARCTLRSIALSVHDKNSQLINALETSILSLKNIFSENAEAYKEELTRLFESREWSNIYCKSIHDWQCLIQRAIDKGNKLAQIHNKREENVKYLNMALQSTNKEEFYKVLQSPHLGLSEAINEFAVPLYYEEMKEDRIESKMDIIYDDIVVSVRVLSSIADVSKAVDTGNPDFIYQKLLNPDTRISELEEENKTRYSYALAMMRHKKQQDAKECPLLTYGDIQECICSVNAQCKENNEVIEILQKLNVAVLEQNIDNMMNALKATSEISKMPMHLRSSEASLYLKLFKQHLIKKHSDGSELWLDDVKAVINIVTSEVEKIEGMTALLLHLNDALEKDDMLNTIKSLLRVGISLPDEYEEKCFRSLQQLQYRKREVYSCPYVLYITDEKNECHINVEKQSYTWDCPIHIEETYYITINDVNEVIKSIIVEKNQFNANRREEIIINFQARIRGYLSRKRTSDRYTYFYDNLEKIVLIQAWWRGITQCKQYHKLLKKKHNVLREDKSLNANTKHKNDVLDQYKTQVNKIIKIQALWRGRISRKAFHSLLHSEKPSFPVVRHFSTILGFNAEDYDKDLDLQKLKHEVVQCIKHNKKLSQQLDSMYVKIGLLVKNKIALQDVAAYSKSLDILVNDKHAGKDQGVLFDTGVTIVPKGLKSLTKEGRKMLEGYQHLFYALQTNPQYLSKLLYLPPHSNTNKLFLKNIILTLFNFGSNTREDYLLLKLFGCALKEDIKCNCERPSDVLTGKPLVREMVVNYAKQLNGQRSLKQIVGPLVKKVLEDTTLSINTNPVDIYKFWRNQLEMESGKSQNIPYTVTQEQALKYGQVCKRLNKGLEILIEICREFLNRITQSRDLIPYGMLYMAKVMYSSLTEKFPDAPEKDVLKAVGNLIYYHFINAAIVAPDTFDVVTLPVDKSLTNNQRKNLATVAKILQFAASKKGFGEEAPHLECLNAFIVESHEEFKTFFRHCCEVEDLEEHFNIHEFTEATLIQNPEIYISLQELCDMHDLMLTYQDHIAPDPSDSLHDLLEDLGPVPSIASLLGISDTMYEANVTRLNKTEVCLVLINKFQVPDNEETNLNNLFIKAKELLVSVIPFLKRQTVVESLETTCSPMHVKLFDYEYSTVNPALNIIRESSFINDCKLQLRSYLHKLELEGWISRADGYQAIVTAIAKDISNKSKYRIIRNKELQTLRATKERLEEKTKYYQEQITFYKKYIEHCVENLHTGKSTAFRSDKTEKKEQMNTKLRSKMSLKYTGWKLHEKGILLEIDGLSLSDFKNVFFDITPSEQSGFFAVRCKFLGIDIEQININIQELLELQYEGSSIMNMFGKAKINVNLLLHLLNRKFYGKI